MGTPLLRQLSIFFIFCLVSSYCGLPRTHPRLTQHALRFSTTITNWLSPGPPNTALNTSASATGKTSGMVLPSWFMGFGPRAKTLHFWVACRTPQVMIPTVITHSSSIKHSSPVLRGRAWKNTGQWSAPSTTSGPMSGINMELVICT